MIRVICFLLFTVSVTISSGQSSSYNIKGKIDGAENVTIFLQIIKNGRTENIDTAVIKNSVFSFRKGSVEYPQLAYLQALNASNSRLIFFLENNNIDISGNFTDFANLNVTGSKTNDEYIQLKNTIEPIYKEYSLKNSEYSEARKNGNTAKAEELISQLKEMPNRMTNLQKEFVFKHPASYVSPVIIQGLAPSMSGPELDELIRILDPAVAKTPVIAELKARAEILKRVEIGQKAPDFTMNDPKGKPVSLSSLTGKKILLIDFWAGWCGPCRQENPNVVRVYNEFKDKGFDILGVSLDRTAADWNKAIADDKLTWNHVSDLKYWDNEAARMYGVSSIPANFLLDKNGIIIARNLRGQDLYTKVKELLGK